MPTVEAELSRLFIRNFTEKGDIIPSRMLAGANKNKEARRAVYSDRMLNNATNSKTTCFVKTVSPIKSAARNRIPEKKCHSALLSASLPPR